MGEGDGTVNLLSTGYMCAKGWNISRYNPAGVKVKVYEMPHEPDRFSPRGGPNTGMRISYPHPPTFPYWSKTNKPRTQSGDHVDILGRSSLNELILRVAGGKGDEIQDHYVSRIKEYAERVKIYEEP
jgi:phospholipid:diacylglycerol acyltransferase